MVRSSTFFSDCTKIKQVEGVFSRFSVAPRGFSLGVFRFSPVLRNTNSRCDVYVFFTIQINLYPFILLSVRFPHTVKYWARLHRAAMTNVRKGSFQKSELAFARAFSRGTHRLSESLLEVSFCKWNRLFPRVLNEKRFHSCMLLGFDWSGWIALIKSEILITTGMA